MAVFSPAFESAAPEAARFGRALARNLAPQDVVVVAFELYLWLRALLAPVSPEVIYARDVSFGLLASTAIALALTRGELLPEGPVRAALHRLGLCVPMACVYLALRRYLPALETPLWDDRLLALDIALFGATPAALLEPFATAARVEWFAFCYYAYFALVGAHLAGSLLFDRGPRATELLLGIALVTAIGQSLYTLVPGVGPHGAVAFERPLEGGYFWAQVLAVVRDAGAGLDIFPSLHTGHPVLIALHAVRHRRSSVYRWSWLPTVALAANMVVSTMFLRWHYGVDVLAGLGLAFAAYALAIRGAAEGRESRQEAFEPLQPDARRAA